MSSNTIFLLPKKSNIPSEKVRKTSGGLDNNNCPLVTNTYTSVKKGNTDMVDKEGKPKQNVVEEDITPSI